MWKRLFFAFFVASFVLTSCCLVLYVAQVNLKGSPHYRDFSIRSGCLNSLISTTVDQVIVSFRFTNCQHMMKSQDFFHGVEFQILRLFVRILFAHRGRALVYDVGCNAGFYSLLSASLGAQVRCFELQPDCTKKVSIDRSNNKYESDISILSFGLSNQSGIVDVPLSGCSGGFSVLSPIEDENSQPMLMSSVRSLVDVRLELHDELRTVDILKIDTEGSEIRILRGVLSLTSRRMVRYLVVELLPHRWLEKGDSILEGLGVLLSIVNAGYDSFALSDYFAYDASVERVQEPTAIANCNVICAGQEMYVIRNWTSFLDQRKLSRVGTNLVFIRRDEKVFK